jgi:hypothetical protein
MSKDVMLTTIDNPFDPFEDFTSWFMFDIEKGYNSCGRLMRIAKVTDDMSQKEYDEAIETAIDELIRIDFLDIYRKVTKDTSESD